MATDTKNLFDYVCSEDFSTLRDKPEFVSERHQVVDSLIDHLSAHGTETEQQLRELQKELDDLRLMNHSPLSQIERIVALIEARVTEIERLAKELKSSL